MCYTGGVSVNDAALAAFLLAVQSLEVHQRVSLGPRALATETTQLCRSLSSVRSAVLKAGAHGVDKTPYLEVSRPEVDKWIVRVKLYGLPSPQPSPS